VTGGRQVGEEDARLARLQRAPRVEHTLERGRFLVDAAILAAGERNGRALRLPQNNSCGMDPWFTNTTTYFPAATTDGACTA
jgi:hypothetical protein